MRFNFFNTATTVLDSDPIDVKAQSETAFRWSGCCLWMRGCCCLASESVPVQGKRVTCGLEDSISGCQHR